MISVKSLLSLFMYLATGLSSIYLGLGLASYLLEPVAATTMGSTSSVLVAQAPPPEELTAPGLSEDGLPSAPEAGGAGADNLARGDSDLDLFLEPYNYDSEGRRDPFAQVITGSASDDAVDPRPRLPLERYDLSQLQLLGVIWDVVSPKAMIRTPAQEIHILGKDERIGRNNGYIAVIREGEVVVVESFDKDGETIHSTTILPISK